MLAFSAMTDNAPIPFLLAISDAFLLAVFSSPMIYFWAVHPYVVARNRTEGLLKKENQRFAMAQRVGQVGSWEFDLDMNEFDLSEEACRIFDVSPQSPTLSYQRYLDAIIPDDHEIARQVRTELLAGASHATVVYRILNPAGGIKWVRESGEKK